jgi:hypothetical protein
MEFEAIVRETTWDRMITDPAPTHRTFERVGWTVTLPDGTKEDVFENQRLQEITASWSASKTVTVTMPEEQAGKALFTFVEASGLRRVRHVGVNGGGFSNATFCGRSHQNEDFEWLDPVSPEGSFDRILVRKQRFWEYVTMGLHHDESLPRGVEESACPICAAALSGVNCESISLVRFSGLPNLVRNT